MQRLRSRTMRLCGLLLGAVLLRGVAAAQGSADLSGTWQQNNDRSVPKRSGEVTLRIEHRNPELTIETTTARRAVPPRHAVQRYTTDGRVSTSTGADGDEFRTSLVRQGSDLLFSIEEHEGEWILHSSETWSVLDSGTTLSRSCILADGARQTLFYRRQRPTGGPAAAP